MSNASKSFYSIKKAWKSNIPASCFYKYNFILLSGAIGLFQRKQQWLVVIEMRIVTNERNSDDDDKLLLWLVIIQNEKETEQEASNI